MTFAHMSYISKFHDLAYFFSVSVKLRERHKERALTSRHSITKHLGKRMALFQIETTNLLESYNKSDHVRNHFNFLSKHDNGNSQM